MNKRLDGIDVKLKTMNIKFKRKFKAIDARLDGIERRLVTMDRKFDEILRYLMVGGKRE